jgi:hypothetical protein
VRKRLLALALFAPALAGPVPLPNIRYGTELAPQYRVFNQEGFSNRDGMSDLFARADAHVEWNLGQWMIEAKPEIRAVLSNGVGEDAPEEVTSITSRRVLNSRRTLRHDSHGEAYFDFDRLNLRHTYEGGEAFLGRKPISLGVLRFFPVWNKLTLPLIFNPGPEWIENPDVLGASFQRGKLSYRAFWARGDRPKVDDIALFESRYFGDGVELQGLAGYWWEHTAAGLAGAFDLWQSTVRLETLWLSRYKNEVSQVQTGLGIERALDTKWTLIGEALYQSAGLSQTQNATAPPNRFMPLVSKFYALPYLTYQLNSLWTLQGGFLAGLYEEMSYVALGGFEYSVSDKTSLTLKVKWPLGSTKGEFGEDRIVTPLGAHMGMSSNVLLILQSTF